mgnify:CR=1 FL=1
MPKKNKTISHTNASRLSTEDRINHKQKERFELLSLLRLKEFFAYGSITINQKTCQGVECRLCIKMCPTNALFWKAGEVGIIDELCIYCGACVLSCIVDNCIKIIRKRATGDVEIFSKPKDFIALQHNFNAKRRFEQTRRAFTESEDSP